MMLNESGTWAQYQKLVLKLLEQHDEKLEALRKQYSEIDSEKAADKKYISSLKGDVDLLLTLIRDGTSNVRPLLSRLENIERELKVLQDLEVTKSKELNDIRGYKRALFISIMGILATIGWDILQTILSR